MKKISLLIAFIFCAIVSYGQFPNDQDISNTRTIYHAKGALKGDLSFMLPVVDTTNNPATPYFGAVTVLPSDVGLASIPIWMSNGTYWIRYNGGTGTNIDDTIWTRLPIFVDYTSDPPKRILTLLHPDGIVTPGYVIWTGIGLNFIVTPAFYYIGYRAFNSPATPVTLAPAPVSGTRSDLFIVDTLATASALTGAAGGVVPQTNPSSQLPLTSVPVNAGDTIPANIQLETLYDEHLAPPAEWTPTTTGTNTVDYDNTDFPYWGTKAAFVSTYTNGSALVFTKSGTPDTVTAGAILRGFISFNIPFTGQLQFQWFNGSTATSNAIAINSGYGINPNNTSSYQIFAIPLNAFTFLPSSNNLFNKLVITFAGSDISGAGGLYLDRLQLQTGLLNIDQPPPPAWYLKGNAGTSAGSDFLGTTDNEPLMFKVNGVQAGLIGNTSTFNTSLGIISLPITSTGIKNTAIGGGALGLNTTGYNNTGLGYTTNYHNLIGNNNTAVGWAAIGWNRGDGNTAVGYSALNSTVSVVRDARHNTAIGFEALQNNGDHKFNIGLGIQAGQLSTTILGGVARDSTLYISNFTKSMYFRIDSATGTAPRMIGTDALGFWHSYEGGGGTLQNAYDASITAGDNPVINAHLQDLFIDSLGDFLLHANEIGGASNSSFELLSFSAELSNTSPNGTASFGVSDSTAQIAATTSGRQLIQQITPSYFKIQADGSNTANARFVIHTDSAATVDNNNIAYFDADTLKRGHLAGGGGGNTIYTANDALASDRIVDLNGKTLIFDESGNGLVYIDPVTFNTSLNATDGTSSSGLELTANSVGSNVLFHLISSNGGNQVGITGEPITNTITHAAGTSIFDGVLRLKGYTVATLPAGTQGDLAFVTDATTPTYNILLVGGGAVVTIAFYNGTNWVAH